VYTGHGGRDINTGKQVTDQELTRQNLALAISCQQGLPVRVIRGRTHSSPHAPEEGYRYDGLYRVEDYWREKGRSGFFVWRFRMRKINTNSMDQFELQDNLVQEDQPEYNSPKRVQTRISRIVRDTELSKAIKELYDFTCQVCGLRIETNAGPYAEAAHIQPLGTPHNGPDVLSNILCLCPNHHVAFDFGGFTILDDFELLGIEGTLTVHPKHRIDRAFLAYHRVHRYEEKW